MEPTLLKGIKNSINFNDYKIDVIGEGKYIYEKDMPNIGDKRFSLELDIENPKGNKSLIVIMMNPSETFPKCEKRKSQIDKTVQNVIRIAYVCGYNKIYVYNIFPLINPDSSFQYEKDEFNTEGIINFLKEKDFDTLIAWGENKEKYVQDILKYLKNRKLFVWDLTKKNKPRHPSPLCNRFIKKFLQQPNSKLIPIKFDDNGNISTC